MTQARRRSSSDHHCITATRKPVKGALWLLGLLTLITLLLPDPARAEGHTTLRIDAEANLTQDDNMGRAQKSRDKISGTTLFANAGVAHNRELNLKQALTWRGFAELEENQEIDGLSRATLGGRFIFRWQNAFGFSAPFYQFNLGLQIDTYDGKQRDSTVTQSQIIATKRLTDRVTGSVGLEYRQRDSDGSVFDLGQTRLFINADYALFSGWAYYGTYSYIDGEIWSTAQNQFCDGSPATDIFNLILYSTAIESDQAFNSARCGNWLAYRLDATTQTLSLGVNKGIGKGLAMDLSVLFADVDATGANSYDRRVFTAALLKRFK